MKKLKIIFWLSAIVLAGMSVVYPNKNERIKEKASAVSKTADSLINDLAQFSMEENFGDTAKMSVVLTDINEQMMNVAVVSSNLQYQMNEITKFDTAMETKLLFFKDAMIFEIKALETGLRRIETCHDHYGDRKLAVGKMADDLDALIRKAKDVYGEAD